MSTGGEPTIAANAYAFRLETLVAPAALNQQEAVQEQRAQSKQATWPRAQLVATRSLSSTRARRPVV
jgi:hypothetical protein